MPDTQPSSHQITTMHPMDDSALASWLTGALAEQMDNEDDEDDDLSESRPIKDQVDTSNRDDDSIMAYKAIAAQGDDVDGVLSLLLPSHSGSTADCFNRHDCRSVNRAGEWTCGKFCEGLTQGTIVRHLLKDKNTLKYGHGVGVVAVQHETRAINVIFRGSSNPGDWTTNLKMRKSDAFKEYFKTTFK
ncbi:hypothetical protein BASA83_009782 [Batrachochytrium salamandrivorans]|nr:hypothetical protein BASA83_009782 [Batrachochytrium salamandrivorans]